MKKQLLSLALGAVLAFGAYANEEAAQLWTKRGETTANALTAANMVRDLAATEQNAVVKADLKTREAEYIYFVGVREGSNESKMKAHVRGQDAAQAAVKLLAKDNSGKQPTSAEVAVNLARAHYFFAINLGKWGEANGVLASLGRWPELRDRLDIIDSLDATVEDFGATRTRARALHKLPGFVGGDKDKSEQLLAEISEKTLADGYAISRNSTTVFFYLDILAENKNTSAFCAVFAEFTKLSEASDADLAAYNAVRVPESMTDLDNFVNFRDFESKVEKFAKRCN